MKKTKVSALCAGAIGIASVVLLSGCHSSKPPSYSYHSAYGQPAATGGTGTGSTQSTGTGSKTEATMAAGQDQVVVPLYEEKLNVGKREVDAGGVRIRKHVTTETVDQPMQLRQETLTIERLPAQAQDTTGQGASATAQASDTTGKGPTTTAQTEDTTGKGTAATQQTGQLGQPFQAGEIVIRLQKEEPVVERKMTQTGGIVAHKGSSTQQTTVKQDVRKERVDIEKLGNPQNVTIPENLQSPDSVGGTPSTDGEQHGAGTSGEK